MKSDRRTRARKMNSRKFRLLGARGLLYDIVQSPNELPDEVISEAKRAQRRIEKMIAIWPKHIKED